MNDHAKSEVLSADNAIATRDMFAAHALAALIAGPKLAGVPRADMDGMAKQSYEYADAMMLARAR